MSDKKRNRSKETFDYKRRDILMLKEAFDRDLPMFWKLLQGAPKSWTFTVLTEGDKKSLVVNVPKEGGGFFSS